MADLDLVCVNYRSEESVVELLENVADLCDRGLDIASVVVDCSGVTDDQAKTIRSQRTHVELLDPGENVGFATAANLGASRGTAPVILFINPDVTVCAEGLVEAERQGRREKAVAWTGSLRNSDGSVQRNVAPPPSLRRLSLEYLVGRDTRLAPITSRRAVAVITGALIFVRRADFEALSGFDTQFPLYMEDVDLSLRLARRGELVQYPIDVGMHVGGQSSRHAPRLTWLLLHSTRVAYFRRRGPISGALARAIVVAGIALRAALPSRREEIVLRALVQVTGATFRLRDLLPARERPPC